jgi:hypothetical protein
MRTYHLPSKKQFAASGVLFLSFLLGERLLAGLDPAAPSTQSASPEHTVASQNCGVNVAGFVLTTFGQTVNNDDLGRQLNVGSKLRGRGSFSPVQPRLRAFLNIRLGFDGDDAMGHTLACTAFHTGRAVRSIARGVDPEVLV